MAKVPLVFYSQNKSPEKTFPRCMKTTLRSAGAIKHLRARLCGLGIRSSICLLATLSFVAITSQSARAQIGFSASKVSGLVIGSSNFASKATSIQFGPDDKLYFTRVDGLVVICDIERVGPDDYAASNVEIISLVKDIPNYDDDGTHNPSLTNRQSTGLLVVGTAQDPVIYVTSSDPREGAGSGGLDLNLDTNSGIISRLTRDTNGEWEKVDIVRGLPRSEENHASNGLQIDATGNTLYLAQGGNTNAGSPSNNFAFACETALAAAILSIDLPAINAMPVLTDAYGQKYIYDLPTLNDPDTSRPENPDGSDMNDPFGGNDGLNQAKIVPGGPVQVYASGFRNPYDILIAKTPGRVGNMYTFDNAGNSGWGGYPKNEDVPATATNEYVSGEPGEVNNLDNLHLISGLGYYGGHPNPIRANPAGAGWFRNDDGPGGAGLVFSPSPTSDWPPVPVSMADPQQGDFRLPGPDNGALFTNSSSTTGMGEYTAQNFGGAMVGDIIVTQYNNATVQRISLNADGTQVTGSSVLLQGSAFNIPLDVAMPGPEGAPDLAGTIFVAHHSNKGITVLEPTDFDSNGGGVCTGTFSFGLDEDFDGYSNADEINNNSDPCSPAVLPPDNDGDLLSDLLDTDDDNDGILDTEDVFPIDPSNGSRVGSPVRYDLFNELGIGFFSIGFTGVMLDPGEDYSTNIDLTDIIAGGTAGLYTDPSIGPGNPHGAANDQLNAFQFGVNVDEFTGPFRVNSGLGGLLFNGSPTDDQSQGVYIGNGDQDNYLKVAVHANSGPGAIEVVHEEDGLIISQNLYGQTGLFNQVVTLTLLVDPINGTVQPGYSLGTLGAIIDVGPPISVGGKILDAIQSSESMAFGLLATTGDVSTPTFNATWDYFEVQPITSTAGAVVTINSGAGNIATSSTFTPGSFQVENTSTGGQNIVSVEIDLSTSLLPDLVFDPAATAGDTTGKGFQLDSFNGLGTPVGTFSSPHDGLGNADGFDVIVIDCGPSVDFRPGDMLTFSSDVDPTSVKGVAPPGPSDAASVSGLELIGAKVTVTYDDGTVQRVRTAGQSGTSSTNKTSLGSMSSETLPTPSLFVPGDASPVLSPVAPTVRVTGPVGNDVEVWRFACPLYLDGVPGGGYDIDPFEANTVISYDIDLVTIPPEGYVDVPVSLLDSFQTDAINYLNAVLLGPNGERSASSDILVIDYDSVAGDDEDPTTPGLPAVSELKAGSVSLVWLGSSDNVGVTEYQILRDGSEVGRSTGPEFTDNTCLPNTQYNYSIVAFDLAGNSSPPSSVVTATTPDDLEDPSVPGSLSGIASDQAVTLSWEESTDDGRVTGYEIYRDGFLVTTIAETTYLDSGLTNGILYDYDVIAVDIAGKSSTAASVSVQPRLLGPSILRVNVGGEEYVDLQGNTWEADYGFNTGDTEAVSTVDIMGTDDDPIYQSRRLDRDSGAEMKYTFPLADGEYEVHLHFVEVWTGAMASGIRVFDVLVEDQLKLDDYDIFDDAGFETATVQQIPVVVTGGEITIEFLHVIQNPILAGIEIYCLECPEIDMEAPTDPSDLTVTNVTPSSVSLSWSPSTDNIGVVGYEVSRDGSFVATVTEASFGDTELSDSTLYQYSVAAVDVAGNLSGGVTINATTYPDLEPPTVPGNFRGVAVDGLVALSWEASADDGVVIGYDVYRDGVLLTTTTDLFYSDSGLANGVLYDYEVIARDSSGKSSTAAMITVEPLPLGRSVLRVNVGGSEYVDTQGEIWEADYGFNTGEAQTSDDSIAGTEDDPIYQSRRFDRATGVPLELKYTFPMADGDYLVYLHFAEVWIGATEPGIRVFDINVEDQLALNDFDILEEAPFATAAAIPIPVSVTGGEISIEFIHVLQNPTLAGIEIFCLDCPDPDLESPTEPTNLVVTGTSPISVDLAWTASTDNVGVVGYEIGRNGSFLQTITGESFSDTGLSDNTLYQYTVSAVDSEGNISTAATIDVTTDPDAQSPTPPGSLEGIAIDGLVVLSWEESTDDSVVVGYEVYRDSVLLATVTDPGYSDPGLTNDVTYTYEVIALDSTGKSSSASSVSVTPQALGPAMLRVNVGGDEYVDTQGNTWAADYGFNTGTAQSSADPIAGTDDDPLYQSRRFDRATGVPLEMKYSFPLPNGSYAVYLHFAEVWVGANGPGIRVFDVNVEDELALKNYDIFADAGFSTATSVRLPATVTDGEVSIEFIHVLQNPTLAGIEIYCLECPSNDFVAPSIEMIGNNPTVVFVGESYTELGATAQDDVDGDLTDDIVIGGDTVVTTAPASFEVTYTVTDQGGNSAVATRDVLVVSPTPPPFQLSVSTGSSADVDVTFDGVTGLQYELLTSTDLEVWTSLGTVLGDGSEISFTHTGGISDHCRFYMIGMTKVD